jgi:CHAT domain-containing protein
MRRIDAPAAAPDSAAKAGVSALVQAFTLFTLLLAAGRGQAPAGKATADKAASEQTLLAERSRAEHRAAMTNGLRPEATREDWDAMHRAAAALVDLDVAAGYLRRASAEAGVAATLHHVYGANHEAELASAQRSLRLLRESGSRDGEYVAHAAVGQALLEVGRADEALAEFGAALERHPEPQSNHAAIQWRRIVSLELGRATPQAAERAAQGFWQAAAAAPAAFRAHAALARAEIESAAGRIGPALERIKEARAIAAGGATEDAVGLEATAVLAGLVLEAARSLPYAEAIALARRVDAEFRDLPIAIAPFATAALRTRQRLAGDFDALLREDLARVEQGRAAGNTAVRIEALRSLAATYGAINATQPRLAALEEAMVLEATRSGATQSGAGERNADTVAAEWYYGGLVALAGARLDAGDARAAQQALTDALRGLDGITSAAVARQLEATRTAALQAQARLYATAGRTEEATRTLQELLARPAAARIDRASVLLQLARIERTASPAAARDRYARAIDGFVSARDRRGEILARLELTRLLAADGSPASLTQARAQLQRLQADASSLNFSDAQWRTLFTGGLVAEAAGQPQAAIDSYRQAVDRLDRIRAGLTGDEARAAFVDSEAIEDLYGRLVARLTDAGRRDDAWEYVERGRARVFLEMLQGRRFQGSSTSAVPAAIESLEREIIDLRLLLSPAQAELLRAGGRQIEAIAGQLRTVELKLAAARLRDAVANTRATQPLAVRPISLDAVRKRLPRGTALIEYALLPDGISTFVVTQQSTQQVTRRTDMRALRADVQRLRTMLRSAGAWDASAAAVHAVARTLLEPVLAIVPPSVDQLIIVPAGYLAYLPFEVLPAADGRPLIDRYAISYLPSASTLQFLTPYNGGSSGSVFLGALGNMAVEDWPPLPGTAAEVTGVARVFPGARLAVGSDFTHDAVVTALTGFDHAHLATHGVLDERTPIFSALLVAGGGRAPSRLSLYELTALRVKARLVVLSACDTGLGQMLRGDEVTGLTRTLLQAGAATVVSSLWQVSDESTAQLMQEFYAGLRAGQSPSRALRTAALAVRSRYPDPFFWAPFVVTGL